MAGLYFTKKKNLVPLIDEYIERIKKDIDIVKSRLPHKIFDDFSKIQFFIDKGMNYENGILGKVSFLFKDRILLSNDIASMLNWKYNETAIGTVVHELTHRQQMTWLGGLAFPIFNIPGVSNITLENWAVQNEDVAADFIRYYTRR